jgi:hypothetical protein
MRTVLIISRWFPPMREVGGKRAYRFAKYLPDYGWRPIVWTSSIPEGYPADPAPPDLTEGRVEPTFEPGWWSRASLAYSTDSAPIAERAGLRGLLKRLTSVPVGKDLLLAPRGAKVIGELCRREKIDVILASSGPHVSLIYGWLAGRLFGIPLCLDLRDPWSLNYLQNRKPSWVRAAERVIERFLFNRADRIIFNSEDATAAYRALYSDLPPERMTTIANSFDPAHRLERRAPDGPILLAHFGNCYGSRRLETVLRAMARLRETGKWPSQGMLLANLGRVSASDVMLAAELGISDAFEYREAVAYEQGLSILGAADLQVLLSYGDETLHIPAKTYDYFLTGSPVLCLARRSQLTELIEQTSLGRVVDTDDIYGAASAIEAAIRARDGGPPVATPNPDVISRYDARHTTAELALLLDEVMKEKLRGRS